MGLFSCSRIPATLVPGPWASCRGRSYHSPGAGFSKTAMKARIPSCCSAETEDSVWWSFPATDFPLAIRFMASQLTLASTISANGPAPLEV